MWNGRVITCGVWDIHTRKVPELPAPKRTSYKVTHKWRLSNKSQYRRHYDVLNRLRVGKNNGQRRDRTDDLGVISTTL